MTLDTPVTCGTIIYTQRLESVIIHLMQQKVGMDPTFFGFRWITLLLSQEFLLPGLFVSVCYKLYSVVNTLTTVCHIPEVIRIWDSLFADENRFDFLIFLCAAMIM